METETETLTETIRRRGRCEVEVQSKSKYMSHKKAHPHSWVFPNPGASESCRMAVKVGKTPETLASCRALGASDLVEGSDSGCVQGPALTLVRCNKRIFLAVF